MAFLDQAFARSAGRYSGVSQNALESPAAVWVIEGPWIDVFGGSGHGVSVGLRRACPIDCVIERGIVQGVKAGCRFMQSDPEDPGSGGIDHG